MDKNEASKYFKHSANKRIPEGMYYIAIWCKDKGQNFSEYVRYLKMAADRDYSDAMLQYASFLCIK